MLRTIGTEPARVGSNEILDLVIAERFPRVDRRTTNAAAMVASEHSRQIEHPIPIRYFRDIPHQDLAAMPTSGAFNSHGFGVGEVFESGIKQGNSGHGALPSVFMRDSPKAQVRLLAPLPFALAILIGMALRAIILAFACLPAAMASAAEIPDPVATPGALNPAVTQENIDRMICLRGWTRAMRPPESYTERIKRDQLYSPASPYYAPETRLREWEEDHRVPLSVGGDPYDQKNLWPEPRAGEWNAERKDQLEERIHNLVCRHVLTLEQGQQVFLGDWREGYRRYVLEREQ